MSSRNVYLTTHERRLAPVLYRALHAGRRLIENGTRDIGAIDRAMQGVIEQSSILKIEYLAVCDPLTLEPLSTVTERAVLLGAIRIGFVRLIDNVLARLGREKLRNR
jgi:pantoate--beta-alanine ligase